MQHIGTRCVAKTVCKEVPVQLCRKVRVTSVLPTPEYL